MSVKKIIVFLNYNKLSVLNNKLSWIKKSLESHAINTYNYINNKRNGKYKSCGSYEILAKGYHINNIFNGNFCKRNYHNNISQFYYIDGIMQGDYTQFFDISHYKNGYSKKYFIDNNVQGYNIIFVRSNKTYIERYYFSDDEYEEWEKPATTEINNILYTLNNCLH